MKATELIEKIQKLIDEHGDCDVAAKGKPVGTFGKCIAVRTGRSPATKGMICIDASGYWRED